MQLDAKRNFFSIFSGYLHLPLIAPRFQADIDDFQGPRKAEDDPDGPPQPLASAAEPDDLAVGRSPLPAELPPDPWEGHDLAAHVRPMAPFVARLPTLPSKPLPHDPVTYVHGGGGDSPLVGKKTIIYLQPHITVDYKDGGEPLDSRITQVNMLRDNDMVTTVDDNEVVTDADPESVVWPEHEVTPMPEVMALAPSHNPNATTSPQSIAHELEARAGSSTQPPPITLHEGVMQDGVPVGSGTPPPTGPSSRVAAPPGDRPSFDNPLHSAVVETGGNNAYNFGAVVDNQGAIGTMIVLGDSYRSDAIHQTNVLVDHSAVAGTAEQAIIQTGGNQANNIAEFVQTLGGQNPYEMGFFGGLQWNVDRVNGDYYDVNLTRQLNVIQDNDCVQQTATDHFKFWEIGGNGQDNVAIMDHSGKQYDLVIVTGDYFGTNWIFQTNILLNSDYVLVDGSGGAGSETVSTGANWLMNSALLIDYSGGTHALTPDMQALVNALQNGDSTMALANGFAVPGDGSGVMNVLFITGNYYDINVLEQTNIVSDSDIVMQTLANGEAGYVATGANQLGNEAVLATIGPLNGQYVGGTQYSEATLVQTNIIAQSADVQPAQSTVVLGDPNKLATEAAALVVHSPTPALPPPEESTAPPPSDSGTHATTDPLSGVLS